jgi:hypothetical protein
MQSVYLVHFFSYEIAFMNEKVMSSFLSQIMQI